MKTLKELVDYAITNRKKSAFVGYKEEYIALGILNAVREGTLYYYENSHGELKGLGVCIPNHSLKIMFVHDILTTDKKAIQEFIKDFSDNYNGYELRAKRKGQTVIYNTHKLMKHLQKGNN
jgi:hypothetical protein